MVRSQTTENSGLSATLRMQKVVAKGITRMTNETCELSVTHQTDKPPTDQVVKIGNRHSGIDMKGMMLPESGVEAVRLHLEHTTKEIGPGVAMLVVTSLADVTSIGIRADGWTDCD